MTNASVLDVGAKKVRVCVCVCEYLSHGDAVRVKCMKDVVGQHQVNQGVFVHLQAKVLAVVPRETDA